VATGLPGPALAQPESARPRCLHRPRPGIQTPAQPGAEGTPAHAGNGRVAGPGGTRKSPAQPGTERRRPGRDSAPRWPSRKASGPATRQPRLELERAGPAGSHPAPAQTGAVPRRPRRAAAKPAQPGSLLRWRTGPGRGKPIRPSRDGLVPAQPGFARRWPSRNWPGLAQELDMPAREGRIHCMPAHEREFRPGKIICRPGELYAGPGSAEVDPGPTYVGRDINMPARGNRVPARRCRCRSGTAVCWPGRADISPGS
jgi:hypothetical protein